MSHGSILQLILLLLLLWVPVSAARGGELPSDWEAYSSDHVTVHAPAGDTRSARTLSSEADDTLAQLMAMTGIQAPERHIQVYLAPDRASFQSIQPGDPPEWAAGTAYPSRALVFVLIRSPGEKSPRQVFVHELAHIVLYWTYGDVAPPRWLDEGLAQVAAGEFNLKTQSDLIRASFSGSLIPLSSLTRSFPSEPSRARTAYAQSRDFVLFYRARYGETALSEAIQAMAAGADASAALESAAGEPFGVIEERWLSRLRRRYAWFPVLGGSGSFWTLAAVLLVAGWFRKRRQHRLKLARMDLEEQLLDERRQRRWPPEEKGRPLWKDPPAGPGDDVTYH